MAHKKGAGSSNNGRESHSKRLGIKLYGGQDAIAGNIIVRQRGTKHHPDKGVGIGKDHTLFALIDGKVFFRKKADNKSYVSVLPMVVHIDEPIHTPVSKKLAAQAAEPEIETPLVKAEPKKTSKKEVEAAAALVETPIENPDETPVENPVETPVENPIEIPLTEPTENKIKGR